MTETPFQRDWLAARYRAEFIRSSGVSFEDFVADLLSTVHEDYINPVAVGRLGDGGADGVANAGVTVYACYGSRAIQDAERYLASKVTSDHDRARANWPRMSEWRFVTNAPFGPLATSALNEIQVAFPEHDPAYWDERRLWDFVRHAPLERLHEVFPGCPGLGHIALADVVPLLDGLRSAGPGDLPLDSIRPVPHSKMRFNRLPETTRLEFNSGRSLAPSIDQWFAHSSDPTLRDRTAANFNEIYRSSRAVHEDPSELVEVLYAAVGNDGFRTDAKLRDAVFAVTAYFFDSCDVFEEPPEDWDLGGSVDTSD